MRTKCLLCGSMENKVIFRELGIDILQCIRCGHIFSSYEIDQNYDGYFGYEKMQVNADTFWADEAHAKMYDDFCRRFIIGRHGRLLDVGTGLGCFVKRISGYTGWETYGYEISPVAVDFARNNYRLENIFCGRVEESNFPTDSFDIITLWDVIEHIPNPESLLSYLRSLLKNDGILFVHTPNAKVIVFVAKLTKMLFGMKTNKHYLEARDHMNLYSMKTMAILLHRNDFTKVKFIHLDPIQSIAGSRSELLKFFKNSYVNLARFFSVISFGRFNFDNLFVVAQK